MTHFNDHRLDQAPESSVCVAKHAAFLISVSKTVTEVVILGSADV